MAPKLLRELSEPAESRDLRLDIGFDYDCSNSGSNYALPQLAIGFTVVDSGPTNPVALIRQLVPTDRIHIALFDLTEGGARSDIQGLAVKLRFAPSRSGNIQFNQSPVALTQYDRFMIYPDNSGQPVHSKVFDQLAPCWLVNTPGEGEVFNPFDPPSQLQPLPEAPVSPTPAFDGLPFPGCYYLTVLVNISWKDGPEQRKYRVDPEMIVSNDIPLPPAKDPRRSYPGEPE